MIKLGTNNIGKIYLGSNSIGKAYLGSNLVFQKGSSPTPPAPTPVFYDYLVFDGTAYIDTDIVPDANASYRATFGWETLKAGQRLFMTPSTVGQIGVILSPSNTTSSTRAFVIYYAASAAVLSQTLSFSYDYYTFYLTPKICGHGSHVWTFTKGSGVPNGGIILGSSVPNNRGQAFTGRMSEFTIYGSDAQNATDNYDLLNYTPAYTLRPCTYNGEAGMWCVETSRFYGNTAGAGTLSVLNNS